MTDWHGWRRGHAGCEQTYGGLHVGPLPGRKQIALYTEIQGVITTLAYFKDEVLARRALEELDKLAK